jgi:hypothetical protein
MVTWPDYEWIGILGRWRIFTQNEEGSSLIGTRSATGWRASASWRRKNVLTPGLQEVLDVGGHGRREAVPRIGELNREAVSKHILYEGGSFWTREINEQGGAEFHAAT